ncbi:MAG: hypothetical protein Q9169_006547 [Polycauliona sp. 2 TL-2023]
MTLFRVPRPTYTIVWIFLLYSFTTRVGVLNPQYISLTLGWSLATVNSLLAATGLLSAVILFALPIIRKFYLEPNLKHQQIDLLFVEATLLLNGVGMAGFGIFSLPPLFIISLLVYTSGNGLYDSLTTVGLTSLTGEQTTGDFLVRSILVSTLGGLIAAPFWSSLFSLCLKSDTLPTGLPYWLSAAEKPKRKICQVYTNLRKRDVGVPEVGRSDARPLLPRNLSCYVPYRSIPGTLYLVELMHEPRRCITCILILISTIKFRAR